MSATVALTITTAFGGRDAFLVAALSPHRLGLTGYRSSCGRRLFFALPC